MARVFVVDDEPDMVDLLATILKSDGFQVDTKFFQPGTGNLPPVVIPDAANHTCVDTEFGEHDRAVGCGASLTD